MFVKGWTVIVLGVDPGSRHTGFAVRDGGTVLAFEVLTNVDELFPATSRWITEVVNRTLQLTRDHAVGLVAVEGITKPNWHLQGRAAANPAQIMATAQVLGGVQAIATMCFLPLVLVPPGKMGSGPLGSYPDDLVSDGERQKADWRMRVGTGQRRHARSAYDVAGQGLLMHMVELRNAS